MSAIERGDVWTAIEDLHTRVKNLEGVLMQLVADDAKVWPSFDDSNPVLVSSVPCTLVAVSVSAVGIEAPNVHVRLYEIADVDDVDNSYYRWVVPGPSGLGAVPYVPIEFDPGVVAVIVDAATGDPIDPDALDPDTGLEIAFATSGGDT